MSRCDNTAVVGIVNSDSSKNPKAMHLMRCLTFLAAKMHFRVRATHIRGVDNILADALSRDNLHRLSTGRPAPLPSARRGSRSGIATRTQLDSEGLDRAVEFYVDNTLAKSTRQSYGSAKRRYHSFCSMFSMSPLPTNEYVLCKYVSFLASNRVSSTSIKCYLAAIRHLIIENGLGDPRSVVWQNWNWF